MGSNGGRLCDLCDPEVRTCLGGKNDSEQLVAETTLLLGFGTQGMIVFYMLCVTLSSWQQRRHFCWGEGPREDRFSYPLCDMKHLVARTTWSSWWRRRRFCWDSEPKGGSIFLYPLCDIRQPVARTILSRWWQRRHFGWDAGPRGGLFFRSSL